MSPRTHEVTLVQNVVSTVTLDEEYAAVRLVFLSGSNPVWFTVDGTTPTVAGDNSLVLAPVVGEVQVPTGNPASETTVGDSPTLNLVSNAAATVEVEGGY
jgi:hypothetical protein